MTREERRKAFIEYELDPVRISYQNAEEDYRQALDEYEDEFGFRAREEYEERYV